MMNAVKRPDFVQGQSQNGTIFNDTNVQQTTAQSQHILHAQTMNGPANSASQAAEYDQWRTAQPPSLIQYSTSASTMPEYIPNYYPSLSPPYLTSISEHSPLSSSQAQPDPMAYMTYGAAPHHHHAPLGSPGSPPYHMDMSMFGPPGPGGYFGAFTSYFPGSTGDYSTWGPAGGLGSQQKHLNDYYRGVAATTFAPVTQGPDLDMGIRQLDQGMTGLNLVEEQRPMHPRQVSANTGGGAPTKKSWANIASQPAKPNTPPKPKVKVPIGGVPTPPTSRPTETGFWTGGAPPKAPTANAHAPRKMEQQRDALGQQRNGRKVSPDDSADDNSDGGSGGTGGASAPDLPRHPVLDQLKTDNEYNPRELTVNLKGARFFVIKSYSEDDIHRSIKYGIWCSTEHGNKRLDNAFKERDGKGPVLLLYSVNGSGHFCGVAQMVSNVDYSKQSGVWAQDKWKGQFMVKWVYVKDVPNGQLRHIRLENNENKPVTNSRDTQEVPAEKGRQVLQIIHKYKHSTSIFDDFVHYEKRQEEEDCRKGKNGNGRGAGDD